MEEIGGLADNRATRRSTRREKMMLASVRQRSRREEKERGDGGKRGEDYEGKTDRQTDRADRQTDREMETEIERQGVRETRQTRQTRTHRHAEQSIE
jgi:hypothetical protein